MDVDGGRWEVLARRSLITGLGAAEDEEVLVRRCSGREVDPSNEVVDFDRTQAPFLTLSTRSTFAVL